MVYRVYSGTMIVTAYRYTGIQVYRVYRWSTEVYRSVYRSAGLQRVYRKYTGTILAL